VAIIEVSRAASLADPRVQVRARVERLFERCFFVEVGDALIRAAARLASRKLRTLDAIHLASAHLSGPAEVIVYDRRLKDAAEQAGFAVVSPGT